MILTIGEITEDRYLSGDGSVFSARVGGAPFNVAVALKKLGADVGFYSRVGKDDAGTRLLKKAASYRLDYLNLGYADSAKTPIILIRTSGDDAEFTSFCDKTSDKSLRYEDIETVLPTCDIVHIGSLLFADDAGRRFAYQVINAVHDNGGKISFDVNIREGVFRSASEMRKVYFELFKYTDYIKFSEAEICTIFDTHDYISAIDDMVAYKKTFFVTLGKNGSIWCHKDVYKKVDTIDIDALDPTGAGDSFFAGVLSQLCRKKDPTNKDVDFAARYGNICGALTTRKIGTVDASPTKEEVEKMSARRRQ